MDLVVFSPTELVPVLRALRGVASANDRFTDAEADLVETVGRLHGARVDARALDPISPRELATIVVDPHRRKRAVQLAIVASLVEGTPDPMGDHAVRDIALALDVSEAGLSVIRSLAGDHALLARLDFARRMRRFVTNNIGLGGLFEFARTALGFARDEELEARYQALAGWPVGTLGQCLHAHYTENGFALPGTPNGMPERFLFHDIGHILSGYDVDPQGEIQQAAFQAGFVRKDGFLFLLFGILQFHLGVRITPIAQAETGYFDVEKVLRAAARGAACKVDLSDGFDFWAHADEQVSVLRERWGVPPCNLDVGPGRDQRPEA